MQQFLNHRKKLILHAAIFIIGIVAVVLTSFLKYRYYMDTPMHPVIRRLILSMIMARKGAGPVKVTCQ